MKRIYKDELNDFYVRSWFIGRFGYAYVHYANDDVTYGKYLFNLSYGRFAITHSPKRGFEFCTYFGLGQGG